MRIRNFKKISIDVLSIGGGGAGVTAAIASARNGAKTAIVSLGKIGNSGNTIMIGGSYAMDGYSAYHDYGIKEADPNFTKEELFEDIVRQGFYISDQNIVEQFVEESPKIVYEVKEWGERAGQKFIFFPPSGWLVSGHGMGRALKQGLKETKGIDIYEDIMILDIIKDKDEIIGAIGIDIYTGEFILFKTKAIIIATGGYQPFSLKNSNSDMTGDGMAMAFRVGAKLADMEFLLFLPTAIEPNEIKGSLLTYFIEGICGLNIKVLDVNGNEIKIPDDMKKIANGSELDKIVSTYYWGKEIFEGNGTKNHGIYFDFSNNTDEEIDEKINILIRFLNPFYKEGYYHGDSIEDFKNLMKEKKLIEVGLGNEYSIGGILVNEKMETGVSGLYAAGEVASGVFGACRVADAVTEMLVQGYKAGENAAKYSKNNACISIDEKQINELINEYTSILENEEGISPLEVHERMEKASDEGFNFFRDEIHLKKALKEIKNIKNNCLTNMFLKSKTLNYNFEWIKALQAKNRLLCIETGIKMAIERKESRGFHMRIDYPEVNNDEYLVRSIATYNDGNIVISKRRPIVTKLELPKGKCENIKEFMIKEGFEFKNAVISHN